MKKILCKFANWILRKYSKSTIFFHDEIYINGRPFKVIEVTEELTYGHTFVQLKMWEM